MICPTCTFPDACDGEGSLVCTVCDGAAECAGCDACIWLEDDHEEGDLADLEADETDEGEA